MADSNFNHWQRNPDVTNSFSPVTMTITLQCTHLHFAVLVHHITGGETSLGLILLGIKLGTITADIKQLTSLLLRMVIEMGARCEL